MPSQRQRYGSWAEAQAVLYLRRLEYEILDRHVTSRYGEIDILARDGATIVAVEVKARRNARYGTPEESITQKKLHSIQTVLEEYCQSQKWADEGRRIDVITLGRIAGQPIRLRHIIGV